jgi:hypothetical protein
MEASRAEMKISRRNLAYLFALPVAATSAAQDEATEQPQSLLEKARSSIQRTSRNMKKFELGYSDQPIHTYKTR